MIRIMWSKHICKSYIKEVPLVYIAIIICQEHCDIVEHSNFDNSLAAVWGNSSGTVVRLHATKKYKSYEYFFYYFRMEEIIWMKNTKNLKFLISQ